MFNSKILRRTLQSVHDTVTESISKVRDSITEALKEENFKPKVKCKNLEAKLFELQKSSNKLDQQKQHWNTWHTCGSEGWPA